MSTRSALILGISMIVSAILIGGGFAANDAIGIYVKQRLSSQERSACWSPSVVSDLNELATQVALPVLQATYPDNISAPDQKSISTTFSASLDNYVLASEPESSGAINCSANIIYSYRLADHSYYWSDGSSVVDYKVLYSQKGWEAEMNGDDVLGAVTYKAPNIPAKYSN